MAANRTSFKKGNPGRPKGAKNRVPPIEVRLRIVGELGPRMFEVLKEALYSPHKCDRQWGAERVLSLLPREDAMKIEGAEPLVIVVPSHPSGEAASDSG